MLVSFSLNLKANVQELLSLQCKKKKNMISEYERLTYYHIKLYQAYQLYFIELTKLFGLKKLLMAESLMKSEPTLFVSHGKKTMGVRTNFICRFNLAAQLYLLCALINNYILLWQPNIDREFVESV